MGSETQSLASGDEPLGWVVLVPLDGVAIVHGELVVEVVVTLTDGNERGDEVVSWGHLVVEASLTEPVGQGVDTEGRVVNKDEASDGSVEESSTPVTPAVAGNDSWEDEAHESDQRQVELVLELDHWVSSQVRDVGNTRLASWLDNHPTHVGPQKTVVGSVWVQVSVGVSVVSAVTTSPPVDGTLDGTGSHECKEVLEWSGGRVGTVRPQSVVSRCDAETSEVVVDD